MSEYMDDVKAKYGEYVDSLLVRSNNDITYKALRLSVNRFILHAFGREREVLRRNITKLEMVVQPKSNFEGMIELVHPNTRKSLFEIELSHRFYGREMYSTLYTDAALESIVLDGSTVPPDTKDHDEVHAIVKAINVLLSGKESAYRVGVIAPPTRGSITIDSDLLGDGNDV